MAKQCVKMICEECGSEDVMHDAWAVWDVEMQDWTLGATFDYAHCDNCEGETHIEEVPLRRRKKAATKSTNPPSPRA